MSGLVFIARSAAKRLGLFTAGMLLASAVVISIVNEFGAMTTADHMLSASGGRYFFIGASSFLILLAATGQCTSSGGRACGWMMIVLVLTNGIITAGYPDWTLSKITGPSYSKQADGCQGAVTCKIRVWPDDARWAMSVRQAP